MRFEPAADGMIPLASHRADREIRCWEFKNANLHRGIIDYSLHHSLLAEDVAQDVRSEVAGTFQPSWWRGFAFGSLLQFASAPQDELDSYQSFVDSFSNAKGVWQWVIAVDHSNRRAFACHMWMQGSLHSSFQGTIERLHSVGYRVDTTYKEKPRLFSRLELTMIRLSQAAGALRRVRAVLSLLVLVFVIAYALFHQGN